MRRASCLFGLAGLALLLSACRGEAPLEPSVASSAASPPTPAAPQRPVVAAPADDAPLAPYTPPPRLGAPTDVYRASRTLAVYATPAYGSPLRGRVPRGEHYFVYGAPQLGDSDCGAGWAAVAEGGWLCLDRSQRVDDERPHGLPAVDEGELLPFIYARHRDHDDPGTPAIPVYRSLAQLNEAAAPVDSLAAYGSYAFLRRYRNGKNPGQPALLTLSRGIVPAAQLERFRASEFRGRDLLAEPAPEGRTLAWAVRWKTLVRAAPDPTAPRVARVRYHDTLDLLGDAERGRDGEPWFAVADEAGARLGFVAGDDVRRWLPAPPGEAMLAGQLLIDVDLDEQTLTLWREDQPIFATLISSGKLDSRTPTGRYRITDKWAYGKMASRPGDDDPYYVDAVPWVMYFDGRYALHAAYWHDLFGHRTSHGCVNLSPADARRVFELSTPTLPPGWLITHEHARDPGTQLRVRRAGRALVDHRGPLPGDGTSEPGPNSPS